MGKKDYYELLGVKKDATESEIKSAFRKKAKELHPDNKETGDEAKFKEIGEAYSVLSDQQKKAQYDRFGHDAFQNGGAGSSGFSGFGGFNSGFSSFDNIDLSDILGDIFGSSFGFGGRKNNRSHRPTKGPDALIRVELIFEEAVFGTEKTLNLDLEETCNKCNGHGGFDEQTCKTCDGTGRVITNQRTLFGTFQTETTCPDCNGKGQSYKTTCSECRGKGINRKNKSILVSVPSGVDTGSQLKLTGKGQAGKNGGENGDIYIEFIVKSHPIFKREENDIYLEVPITFTEAALGCKKNIPTIYGNVILDIKEGTNSEDIYKLKGKGINESSFFGKGDMYVTIKVITPSKLSKEQRKILQELEKTDLDNEKEIKEFNKYIK